MIINVKVKTNSGKQEIVNSNDNNYIVYLKSLPIENKANIELVKLLKKYFKKDIKILKGKSSRNKVIDVN